MDKWLKRIWLVNGILLLFALTVGISDRIQSYLHSRSARTTGPFVGQKLQDARSDSLALQDIMTTIPRRIGSTSYSFVALVSKDLERAINLRAYEQDQPASEIRLLRYSDVTEAAERNSLYGPGTVNLAFLSDDGSDIRLLTQQRACITSADIPQAGDTVQQFILYRIVFKDTNGDGRLTDRDQTELYISDISGRNLRRVAPESLAVQELVKSFRQRKLIIRAQVRPGDPSVPRADWREQVCTYSWTTGAFTQLLPDKQVLDLARRILWGQ